MLTTEEIVHKAYIRVERIDCIDRTEHHWRGILLVLWILDRLHGLIFPVKVYILPEPPGKGVYTI
jgi:hypothetical protein